MNKPGKYDAVKGTEDQDVTSDSNLEEFAKLGYQDLQHIVRNNPYREAQSFSQDILVQLEVLSKQQRVTLVLNALDKNFLEYQKCNRLKWYLEDISGRAHV